MSSPVNQTRPALSHDESAKWSCPNHIMLIAVPVQALPILTTEPSMHGILANWVDWDYLWLDRAMPVTVRKVTSYLDLSCRNRQGVTSHRNPS